MSQQNQITGVRWQYFPCVGMTISHTVLTAGFMPQERGSPICVAITVCGDTYTYLYVRAAASLPVPSKLHWGSAGFLLLPFHLQPPIIVGPTKSWDFLSTLLLLCLSTAQGMSQVGAVLATMGLLCIPLSEYDLSGKSFMFLHMLSQLFRTYFSGIFFVLGEFFGGFF